MDSKISADAMRAIGHRIASKEEKMRVKLAREQLPVALLNSTARS